MVTTCTFQQVGIKPQREGVLILSIRRDPFVLQCTFTEYFAPHVHMMYVCVSSDFQVPNKWLYYYNENKNFKKKIYITGK